MNVKQAEPIRAQQVAFSEGHLLDLATLEAMQRLQLEEQQRHLVRQHGVADHTIHSDTQQEDKALAERITAPSSKHRIRLDDADQALIISGDSTDGVAVTLSEAEGLRVRGNVTLERGRRLLCHGLEFTKSEEDGAPDQSDADHVVSISLRSMAIEGNAQNDAEAPTGDDGAPIATRLCWAISAPADSKTDPPSRIRVGMRNADGAFEPIMTIESDGQTMIDGDLHFTSNIVEGPIDADVNDHRFLALLRRAWQRQPDDPHANSDHQANKVGGP
jgi:hypothetical protein